jgi:tetratricopeptide (TPR) repeat protein
MSDEISRWSDELARNPSSFVFLQLGEALRRQGQLEIALKIALRGLERHPQNADAHDLVARIAVDRRDFARASTEWQTVLELSPNHLGAMKGLGYVSFHQGRFGDAERYLSKAAAEGAGSDVNNALEMVRRSTAPAPVVVAAPSPHAEIASLHDPERLFADLLVDDAQTALLLDTSGYVLGGIYFDSDGVDVSQDIGAQLNGISEEIVRSMKHLDIGEWQSITFETHAAVVAMAPAPNDALVVVAASRATPLGLVRRLHERCAGRAAAWLARGGEAA